MSHGLVCGEIGVAPNANFYGPALPVTAQRLNSSQLVRHSVNPY